jgi:type VI secretion system protein ImpL
MNTTAALRAHLASFLRGGAYSGARLLLLAWAIGLAIAAWHLDHWRQDLTRTLVQLNADASFRARAQHRDAVDPEWYRRKALNLLATAERMKRDTSWTLVVPGSWNLFDDLEEQVQDRIAREFGEIVVETIRRELVARTSALTGVPQVRGAADLGAGGECQSPIPQNLDRRLSAAPEDLPEFVAVTEYVAAVEQLDDAVQAFLSLQYSGGDPAQLRKLVKYTLNAELPGSLAESVALFHRGDEVKLQPALMQSRLQWATRCALAKGMSALYTRLLNTNDLLALEQGLAERSAGLFDPGAARTAAFDRTLERYRAVHGLLEDQHELLAKGRNAWMRNASLQLGPGYQDVLKRITRTRLLGPETVQQLQSQSGAAFAEFRRQFESAFGREGEPGIVWVAEEQRFALSPDRAGLRQGLGALLKTPFMADEAVQAPPARGQTSLAAALQEARTLAEARARFVAEALPAFPAQAQPVVARVVDTRVSELIYQQAYRALKAALPADSGSPLDPVAFRQQRDQVLAVHALLKETGGAGFGERLLATLDGELLRRLAVLHEDWRQQPLLRDGRASDFGWWQGDALLPALAIGAGDAAALPASIASAAARLDVLGQQAKALVALGTPALAADPAAQRWLRLHGEVGRYHASHADSSLLRLERYLAALGPDLRRENCAERLAANLPQPHSDDEVALRLVQIHNALARRCNELRAQTVAAPATLTP